MLYSRRPSLPLSAWVDQLWYCENYQSVHRRERVLPGGSFDLILDLACGAPPLVCGIRSGSVVIETAALRAILGVVFRPGGARAFFAGPSDAFANRQVPLDCVWGADADRLVDRLSESPSPSGRFDLVEAALLARIPHVASPHPAVTHALAAIERSHHAATSRRCRNDSGSSRRRLSQLFREQVGLTPKLFCRLRRFRDVVEQAARGGPVDWAGVAAAGGFSDQSHLAHDFREFSGLTPGEYLAAVRPHPNHVPLD